jgi:hypothetical protein
MNIADKMIALDDGAVRPLSIIRLMDKREELRQRIDDAIATLSREETALLIRLMKQRERNGGGANG